ncbi:hypothetical protein NIES1031_07675 [Chroogloeocystis siderophila 5.2 s.c.1]|uniref:Uncharacterized protein n=1 Tax=Chroogloeocystis siderophila 5.2 s.c.1 TaxID=247279 RepID=A0A1U7HW15_9CHRO|nr:hypothetical protein NIES1031_07675 [Chroogloeocystis siderophila 5.2 s.c.1]
MLKLVFTTIQTLISIYWLGATVRQNPAINEVVRLVEEGYARFNSKLKDGSVSAGLKLLKILYGRSAAVLLMIIIIYSLLFKGSSIVAITVAAYLFLFSSCSWFSIKWCTEHRTTLKQLIPWIVVYSLTPFLITLLFLLEPTSLNPFTVIRV